MSERSTTDEQLRHVLEEVAAGRMLVEEAIAELDHVRPRSAPLQSIVLSTPRYRGSRFVSLSILLFAAMIGSIGGFFGWRTLRFELYGRTTDGKVIRMVHGGGAGNHMKPVVAYAVDGKQYEVTGIISSSPPAFSVGDKAVVHYNPEDPSDAQVSGFIERWLFLVIFGGIGAVLGCIGVACMPRGERASSGG